MAFHLNKSDIIFVLVCTVVFCSDALTNHLPKGCMLSSFVCFGGGWVGGGGGDPLFCIHATGVGINLIVLLLLLLKKCFFG